MLHDTAFGFAIIDVGGTELGIATHAAGETMMPGNYRRPRSGHPEGVEIAFYTEDVSGAYQKAVQAGAASVAEPKAMSWGQTVAYVRSIEGTVIGLCSPLESGE